MKVTTSLCSALGLLLMAAPQACLPAETNTWVTSFGSFNGSAYDQNAQRLIAVARRSA